MMFSAPLLLTLAAATVQVAAIPFGGGETSIDGLRMVSGLIKNVSEVIHGVTVKVAGSQEDIDEYLAAKKAEVSVVAARDVPQALQKRVDCANSVTNGVGIASALQDGVNHLNYLESEGYSCVVAAHTCLRITCSYDSEILMCNNSGGQIVSACSQIAAAAESVIHSSCNDSGWVFGQAGTSTGVIVALGGSPTHC